MNIPAIDVRGAEKTYSSGQHVVNALLTTNLKIHPGDYVAVMGPSGSGKSTFLNIVGLLTRPSGGTVVVDGRDTGKLGDRDLSRLRGATLGFVFQSYHLMRDRTALENVELPLVYGRIPRKIRRHIASEALVRVGLGSRTYAFPAELSGGERQRVAIARAVARRPQVLLCDEPTGNLDATSSQRIMALLGELNKGGITVVVVTHDAEVARYADRLLEIKDGVASEMPSLV